MKRSISIRFTVGVLAAWATGLALTTATAQQGDALPRNAGRNVALVDDRHPEAGFQSMFNGTDLTGWDGNPKLWSVRDGAITGQTTVENPANGNTFLIWTNGTPGDFELRCSFKLVPGD